MTAQPAAKQGQELNDSRFHMWRAVFALAHADGRLTDKETAFIENYLQHVPFSEKQKQIIRDDLENPQSINAMLIGISKPEDMADFFQFAQMLVWCDGDYDEQEQVIIERLTAEQMNRFNKQEIAQQLREARIAGALRREIEDEEFRRQAKELVGIGAIGKSMKRAATDAEYRKKSRKVAARTGGHVFKNLFSLNLFGLFGNYEDSDPELGSLMQWMSLGAFPPPDEELFALWRAVFALVHADDKVTPEEEQYVNAMMQVFMFSEDQQRIIHHDMKEGADALSLFGALQGTEFRRQFLKAARTIIWCDGQIHDREREVMNAIKHRLGADAANYEEDLAWFEKKPEQPSFGKRSAPPEENMLKDLFRDMFKFHKSRQAL